MKNTNLDEAEIPSKEMDLRGKSYDYSVENSESTLYSDTKFYGCERYTFVNNSYDGVKSKMIVWSEHNGEKISLGDFVVDSGPNYSQSNTVYSRDKNDPVYVEFVEPSYVSGTVYGE